MNDRALDVTTTRAAASLSRRASLIGLLGAALAPALAVTPASAKKKGRNRKNKKSNKDSRCEQQVAMCEASITRFCPRFLDPEACEAVLRPCCSDLRTCEVDAALVCIVTESGSLEPVPES